MNIYRKGDNVYQKMSNWINDALSQTIPEGVAAFCFNLYEEGDNRWSMEIIGAEKFDLTDQDWPCYEITDFGTRGKLFSWEKAAEWDVILDEMTSALKDYLEHGSCADLLKSKDGVGVGFVDGDIVVLHHK